MCSSSRIPTNIPLKDVFKRVAIPDETKRIIRSHLQGFLEVLLERVTARLGQPGQPTVELCEWCLATLTDLEEVFVSFLVRERVSVNIALVLNHGSNALQTDGGSLVIKDAAGNLKQMNHLDFDAVSRALDLAVTDILQDEESGCIKACSAQYNGCDCKSYELDLEILLLRFTPVLVLNNREYCTFDHSKVVGKILRSTESPAQIAAGHHPLLNDLFPIVALTLHREGILRLFPRTALYRYYVNLFQRGIEQYRPDENENLYKARVIREIMRVFWSHILYFDQYGGGPFSHHTRHLFSAFDENIEVFTLLLKDGTGDRKVRYSRDDFCIATSDDPTLIDWISEELGNWTRMT